MSAEPSFQKTIIQIIEERFNDEKEYHYHQLEKQKKWLVISCLQKSIRRGLLNESAFWIEQLWHIDKAYALFRLGVIASEEVAGANLPLAHRLLQTKLKKNYFDQVDTQILKDILGNIVPPIPLSGIYFATLFAHSPKDRSGSDLFALIRGQYAPITKSMQTQGIPWEKYATDHEKVYDLVTEEHLDIRFRALALWFMAGAKLCPNPTWSLLPPEKSPYFEDAIEALCAGNSLLQDTASNALLLSKEIHPLAISLIHNKEPLKQSKKEPALHIPSVVIKSVPLCAIDKTTVEGKRAIKKWYEQTPEFKKLLSSIPENKRSDYLGELLFIIEGRETSKTSGRSFLKKMEDALWLDISNKLKVPRAELEKTLIDHMEVLQKLRVQEIVGLWE